MLSKTTRRWLLVGIVSGFALTAVALAAGSVASGTLVKTHKASLGTILVNAQGKTLYMFLKDRRNKSACSGQCTTFWPPLITTAKPRAGAGTRASLLGTTRRSDGRLQVTYNGHPLYRFSLDLKAGQTKGQGIDEFGAEWYVVSPGGAKVDRASSSGGGYGGGGYGG